MTRTGIEEKLAILEMIAQYSYTYDERDADGFAQVFLEEGVLEIFVPGKGRPAVRLQSRQEIHAWAAQRLQEREGRCTGRHYQSGIRFDELTAAQARVRVMLLVTRQHASGTRPYVNLTGVYHDVWQKTAVGWRLAHRAAYTDRDPGFSSRPGVVRSRARNLGVQPPRRRRG
jgi:SnoaL-like protein